MTIEQAYNDFAHKLKTIYEEREALNIADWVFENVTCLKRWDRLKEKEQLLNNTIIDQFNNNLKELLQHKPVQYVLGEAWFYKMKLFVNEHVLIPRPETEELVEWVLELKIKNEELKILDVGTGSGCIAIALKKALPYSDVVAIDISDDALQVAAKNAKDLNAEVQFIKLDFLNDLAWKQLPLFDIVVSNPPYIPQRNKHKLNKNVAEFEPEKALFVNDNDPFIFYRNMATFCKTYLKENGKIFVEINDESAIEVSEIFSQHQFKSAHKKDMYGNERMICAWK